MIKMRKIIMAAIIAGIMSLGITGCGKETEEIPVQAGAEEIPEEEKDTKEPAAQSGEEPEDALRGGESGKEAKEQETEEKNPDADASTQAGTEELYGNILEIGEKQFIVSEITVTTEVVGGSEAEVMVVGAPGNEEINKITVVYDEATVFTKRTIWDGGEHYEDAAATGESLAVDLTAEMKGSYEGDVFHATEIRLVEVIL